MKLSLLSEEKLETLRHCVEVAPINGIFIEVGVYKGGSLLEIAKHSRPSRIIYGFDTFSGLPKETYEDDEFHKPKEFSADFEEVKKLLAPHKNVSLVKGLFPSSGKDLERISFAHLDMDHWRGTLDALAFVWHRLMPRGIVLIDDYNWKKCPGITPVVDTWAAAKRCEWYTRDNQAVLING